MPERVTFTRKSADRIAKVVKRVENMPPAEPIQQRRRAGGYTMQSLFEVTAVQTGAETVTLKRVQDTDDNLNDRSETLDVAYDPENEPAVEDRGMIIRLGDGTRFFFKRRGLTCGLIGFPEWAEVRQSSPDTTFNYQTDPVKARWTNSVNTGIVYKLSHRIPQSVSSADYSALCLGEFNDPNNGMKYFGTDGIDPNFFSTIDGRLSVHAIAEDFDCSAVTWNSVNALSKSGGADHYFHARVVHATFFLLRQIGGSARTQWMRSAGAPLIFNNTYGFFLLWNPVTTRKHNTWDYELQLNIAADNAPDDAHIMWAVGPPD